MSLNTKYPRAVAHQQKALACIRIGIGLCFLWMVAGKLDPKWVTAIAKVLEHSAQSVTIPGYATFLKEIVLPMGPALAYSVILGELTVGICLVLGLFTAPAAMLGAFLNLNYLLGLGASEANVLLNLSFIVTQVALAVGHAGTTWGLDALVLGKMPFWLTGLFHHESREF